MFSKFEIGASVRRVALPPIKTDSYITRFFNLRRAVQCVTLPCSDGTSIDVLNTHLSSFSKNDGTVEAQVAVLRRILSSCGKRWLLAGDFNALPPGVDPETLSAHAAAEHVEGAHSIIAPLFKEVCPSPLSLRRPNSRPWCGASAETVPHPIMAGALSTSARPDGGS